MDAPDGWGFDAAVEFPPHNLEVDDLTPSIEITDPQFQGAIWDYVYSAKSAIARRLPGVSPASRRHGGLGQHAASCQQRPRVRQCASGELPAVADRDRSQQTARAHPSDEQLVFINAWNEWAEGCHLEPDLAFGRAYLEATKAALDMPR